MSDALSNDPGPSVWVDGRPLENVSQRGIARVMIETLRRSADRAQYTIGLAADCRWGALPGVRYARVARAKRYGHHRLLGCQKILRERRLAKEAGLPAFEVYHSHFFVPCPAAGPAVVQTIHDMIPEELPAVTGRWGRREARRKRLAINASHALVCISEATRRALLRLYPKLPVPIFVIHHGGEHLVRPAASPAPACNGAVLFVGRRDRYKNFRRVLEAMTHPDWPSDLTLRVVGAPFSARERKEVLRLGIADRVTHCGEIDDAALTNEYRRAAAFVFPSLGEGFGLPLLEAQSNRCPVVASDTPVFREVAGDGAEFFKPDSAADLAAAVRRLNSGRRAGLLVEEGVRNFQRFSWDAAAEKTIDAYREITGRWLRAAA